MTILLSGLIFQINAQTDQMENLAQYLFPQFSKGIVKMKTGKDLSLNLNYNIVTEKMVFIQKEQVFDLVNAETVDTIKVNNKLFIPKGKIFLEVLSEGEGVLYLQHKASIVDPGKPAAYGGTSQTSSSISLTRLEMGGSMYNMKLPDNVIVKSEPVYWIIPSDKDYSFTNERQFLKIFKEKESEIKKYIKTNDIKFDDPSKVFMLFNYCRELTK